MEQLEYKLTLNEREVRGVGERRWFRKNQWQFYIIFIPLLITVFSVLLLPDQSWTERVVGGIGMLGFVVVFLRWMRVSDKRGLAFLQSVKEGKQN